MKIEWNRVTWYSKALAVMVFVATFVLAFYLGILWKQVPAQVLSHFEPMTDYTASSTAPAVGAGAHCGGFIRNAPVCGTGLHCALSGRPDTGGTCVAN